MDFQFNTSKTEIEMNILKLKTKIIELSESEDLQKKDLMVLINILLNDEHIFFNVIEDVFREFFFTHQELRNELSSKRLIGLTNAISSICELNS